jgi:anti-sigma regulatory factor (Ser/Thr protein kinase)
MPHEALLYRNDADYTAGVVAFVTAAVDAAVPILVAVPPHHLDLVRGAMGARATSVEFEDMSQLGRNPARIIPAIRRFLERHPDRPARFVGEPAWPGRSTAELTEASRHEAMLNTAFAGAAVDLLCPYDAHGLDAATISTAWLTHPWVVDHSHGRSSPQYAEPERLYAIDSDPLESPPEHATSMPIDDDDLFDLRDLVRHFSDRHGLTATQVQDLVLAVNEIATNTLVHTTEPGTLTIWRDAHAVVCEVRDSGLISDPFAGRRPPDQTLDHGRGLWMANQLCDLVQLRSGASGTTVRLHMTTA